MIGLRSPVASLADWRGLRLDDPMTDAPMIEILPETTFRAATGLELSRVPDGATVYDAARERVHFLNPTALIVFELCDMQKSAEAIEAFVTDAFGLEEPPREAVQACLQSLVSEGLVTPCPPSSAGR